MNMMTALPRPYVATPSFVPRRSPERFRRMVALFERDEIEDAIEALIAYKDSRDGDPDLEETGSEDSFCAHASIDGRPGCPVADPDYGVDDQGEEIDEREPEDYTHEHPSKPPAGAGKSREKHLQRIRRDRCTPVHFSYRDWNTGRPVTKVIHYALKREPKVDVRLPRSKFVR